MQCLADSCIQRVNPFFHHRTCVFCLDVSVSFRIYDLLFTLDGTAGFLNELWFTLGLIFCRLHCGTNTLSMSACSRTGAELP